jgi:hypothetical protein
VLVLQGRRDYQVTVDDDLTRWQAGLAGRADVAIRVYDADDHMFFSGAGDSTPADYQVPQHVDPAVIADIADWLMPGRGQRPFTGFISGRRQDCLAARARGYLGLVRRQG